MKSPIKTQQSDSSRVVHFAKLKMTILNFEKRFDDIFYSLKAPPVLPDRQHQENLFKQHQRHRFRSHTHSQVLIGKKIILCGFLT